MLGRMQRPHRCAEAFATEVRAHSRHGSGLTRCAEHRAQHHREQRQQRQRQQQTAPGSSVGRCRLRPCGPASDAAAQGPAFMPCSAVAQHEHSLRDGNLCGFSNACS
eukprot:TRINITY_DN3383_c0_g1_i1.p4 TRINITY_DN3383_c0_g1~~TRINITY_DN3383_c0_g1_i1.p4  ORF type:complete len:107 (+),score=20.06 TRINITY_DN3383_c0_g1_i1:515-835(+)